MQAHRFQPPVTGHRSPITGGEKTVIAAIRAYTDCSESFFLI
jgi:hypothetical protein